jgi:hypothetical protein
VKRVCDKLLAEPEGPQIITGSESDESFDACPKPLHHFGFVHRVRMSGPLLFKHPVFEPHGFEAFRTHART